MAYIRRLILVAAGLDSTTDGVCPPTYLIWSLVLRNSRLSVTKAGLLLALILISSLTLRTLG